MCFPELHIIPSSTTGHKLDTEFFYRGFPWVRFTERENWIIERISLRAGVAQFASNPVENAQFASNPVENAQFASNPVENAQFASNPVENAQFSSNPVENAQFSSNPVENAQFASNAQRTRAFVGAWTSEKIARIFNASPRPIFFYRVRVWGFLLEL